MLNDVDMYAGANPFGQLLSLDSIDDFAHGKVGALRMLAM